MDGLEASERTSGKAGMWRVLTRRNERKWFFENTRREQGKWCRGVT